MAEVQPPLFIGVDGEIGADELGLPFRDLVGEGVVGAGDLEVTQRGAGANMSVDVAKGAAWVKGDDNADAQPTYRVRTDATVNLAIAGADATNPRIDRVIAEVLDSAFSGVSLTWRLRIVQGVPTAGATLANLNGAAAVPNNALLLANVLVPNAAGSIVDADIANIAASALVGGGAASAFDHGHYVLLLENELAIAAASLDLPAIPSGYRDLRVIAELQGSAAGTGVQVNLRVNGDAGATQYAWGQNYNGGTGASSGSDHIYLCDVAAAAVGGNEFGVVTFDLPAYAETEHYKALTGRSLQSAAGRIWTFGGGWKSTAAVNRLTFLPASGNFVAGSRARVYGLR